MKSYRKNLYAFLVPVFMAVLCAVPVTVRAELMTGNSTAGSYTSIEDGNAVVEGITDQTWNGKAITQTFTVKIGDYTLVEGTDYSVMYENNDEVGTATIIIDGMGTYYGTITETFNITESKKVTESEAPAATTTVVKKANTMTVKAKVIRIKYSALQKKKKVYAKKKAFTVKKAKGKVTFKKKKGNKKILISKTGRVTVKKGLKRGTWKVKVQVTAAGNKNYKAKSKIVTLKVIVKK